jgi:hypothetical protein
MIVRSRHRVNKGSWTSWTLYLNLDPQFEFRKQWRWNIGRSRNEVACSKQAARFDIPRIELQINAVWRRTVYGAGGLSFLGPSSANGEQSGNGRLLSVDDK